MTKVLLRKVAGLIATAVALSVFSIQAMAHTGLRTSVPADGATVTVAPEQMVLTFSAKVRLVKLEFKGVGHDMPTDFAASAQASDVYTVKTPGMHPGAFTVNWTVIGADGHSVSDTFGFTVDPDADK